MPRPRLFTTDDSEICASAATCAALSARFSSGIEATISAIDGSVGSVSAMLNLVKVDLEVSKY
jgi:hypothetical protein